MALMTPGIVFGVTESVTNTKLYNLVALGTVTQIVDGDIDPGAAIQFSKILATGIDASLFVGFPNAQVAAGKWPFANLPVPFGATYVCLVSIPNASLLPLTLASWVDGASFRNMSSLPSLAGQMPWYSVVSSLASGAVPVFNGTNSLIGKNPSEILSGNTIFSFSGSIDNAGFVSGTTLTTATTSNFTYWAVTGVQNSAYKTIINSKWVKIAGINTVTVWAKIWQAAALTAQCKVNIGTANGSVNGTASQTTPEWKSFTIDVTGLNNGTTYDVTIQLANSDVSGGSVYLGTIIALGS